MYHFSKIYDFYMQKYAFISIWSIWLGHIFIYLNFNYLFFKMILVYFVHVCFKVRTICWFFFVSKSVKFLGAIHEDHIKNKRKISHSPMNLERKTASCWIYLSVVCNGVRAWGKRKYPNHNIQFVSVSTHTNRYSCPTLFRQLVTENVSNSLPLILSIAFCMHKYSFMVFV